MVKILAVEDEDVSLSNLRDALQSLNCSVTLDLARSRDEAIELLNLGSYDLVICDLRIPSARDVLDAEESHGLAVYAHVRQILPGVPAIFLTAFPENRSIAGQLATGDVANYYGRDRLPIACLIVKGDQAELIQVLDEYLGGFVHLDDIPVICDKPLDEMLLRSVRQYARGLSALEVKVKPYGGSSGAFVARADLLLPDSQTCSVVVKVQDRGRAMAEALAYRQNVPNRLQVGYFATTVDEQHFGLRSMGAVVWSIAPGLGDLFQLMGSSMPLAAETVMKIARGHEPWTREVFDCAKNVGELRRALNDKDRVTAAVAEEPLFAQVESLSVDLKYCTSHGDLHGANVFADGTSGPVLIDFGDVGSNLSAIDPVTLELSVLFNKQGPLHGIAPPNLGLDHWNEVEAFAGESVYRDFFSACRAWASRVSDPVTVLTAGYVHAMRQLKYDDIPEGVPLAIARSAAAALLERTVR